MTSESENIRPINPITSDRQIRKHLTWQSGLIRPVDESIIRKFVESIEEEKTELTPVQFEGIDLDAILKSMHNVGEVYEMKDLSGLRPRQVRKLNVKKVPFLDADIVERLKQDDD